MALVQEAAQLRAQGRGVEALAKAQEAARLGPDQPDILQLLAVLHLEQGDPKRGLPLLERAVQLAPNAEKLFNLGIAREESGQWETAIAAYEQALALDAARSDIRNNLAMALAAVNRLAEAEATLREVLAREPGQLAASNNLGIVLRKRGRLDEAQTLYAELLARAPHDANALYNRAMLAFEMGDLRTGFAQYATRFAAGRVKPLRFGGPAWRGEPLYGRTLLIQNEQGFGDAIQYIRFARLVKAQGARVIVAIEPALHRLFNALPWVDQCIGLVGLPPAYDFQVAMMDLPGVLGLGETDLPGEVGYLPVLPEWRGAAQSEAMAPDALNVGLVWRGSAAHSNDHNRSLEITALEPLLSVPGVRFHALVKDLAAREKRAIATTPTLINREAELEDFAATAAVVESLDLLISVDTAALHLGGALNKPTWGLLHAPPEWRWMWEREDSPWYPSVRLFRQPHPGNWAGVVEQVAQALCRLVG
ncbi:tetratricopeptide repeat protein [Magnetofaba australis]|uniref:Putative TPR domain-containing protein n=1 Tax=Magnetofaba australis IT-1 TaxID=1434232 RepID=A0A1Y2K3V2_9PROT|nr:tetratricopeptide repeat protein [Magnetofaba australis]OSM02326.1 putative TPR domain-containing protein [Magnetofaba australis IT-1]